MTSPAIPIDGLRRPIELYAGVLVAVSIGTLSMVAVVANVPQLSSIVPWRVPVAATTGLCLVLLAAGLWGAYRRSALSTKLAVASTIGAGAIASVAIAEYVTGQDLGLRRWLFPAPPGSTVMSPQTALAVLLIAVALLASIAGVAAALARALATVAGVIATVNIVDALYGFSASVILPGQIQMALPTALAIVALALGVVALKPRGTLLSLLRLRGPAGSLSRRLMVAALVIPVTVGWLRLAGERAGMYEGQYGVALTTVASIILFTAAVHVTARAIARTDDARRDAENEREAARQAAEKASQAKSEFMSRMSHELRTPLNAILGFAQLLEMDELSAEQAQHARYIGQAGRHLLELINEVLDIGRIESGQISLSLEPVPVAGVIDEVVAMLGPQAEAARVSVDASGAKDEAYVLADRQRLKQVVLNLVANAIKYNRAGGSVCIASEVTGDGRLRLSISDTGRGIAADKLDRLFVPFDRLGAEQSGIEGTGIGLALSRGLTAAMGGQLRIESQEGVGTSASVELPAAQPAETLPAAVRSASRAVAPQAEQALVLYVEDNPANLRLVERILAHRPQLRLLAASRGDEGLQLVAEQRPDLILLDLHLPDMPGDEVLHRLKSDPATQPTPVIVITADATGGQASRLRALGAASYLTKPLDVNKFLDVLDSTLEAAPQRARGGEVASGRTSPAQLGG